ncbi:transglutaminase domain-containing protein, partial [Klebsiella pneumoniae]|uniref:transglutaminase domain-containing protein n=1 Tax=Klebsiella pneumoniae TaxID=573 RepID=UPI00272F42A7
VSETFDQARGNCLSFTLLFISAARALGIEAHAREVRVPLAWRQDEDLIFDVRHVNVGVDTPGSRKTVDFDPDFLRSQRL